LQELETQLAEKKAEIDEIEGRIAEACEAEQFDKAEELEDVRRQAETAILEFEKETATLNSLLEVLPEMDTDRQPEVGVHTDNAEAEPAEAEVSAETPEIPSALPEESPTVPGEAGFAFMGQATSAVGEETGFSFVGDTQDQDSRDHAVESPEPPSSEPSAAQAVAAPEVSTPSPQETPAEASDTADPQSHVETSAHEAAEGFSFVSQTVQISEAGPTSAAANDDHVEREEAK
jgi:hypothetical protein